MTIAGPTRPTPTLTRPKRWRGLGGCDFAADPTLSAAKVRVFWSPSLAFDTLTLTTLPGELRVASPSTLPPPDSATLASDGAHILLAPGAVAQLWLAGQTSPGDEIGLLIPLDEGLPIRLAAALDLWRRINGQPAERERLTPQRRRRLVDGLRALDARHDGASYRAIALALFPAFDLPAGAEWKANAVRAQTMRLVADATQLMRGGYRDLLRRGRPAR